MLFTEVRRSAKTDSGTHRANRSQFLFLYQRAIRRQKGSSSMSRKQRSSPPLRTESSRQSLAASVACSQGDLKHHLHRPAQRPVLPAPLPAFQFHRFSPLSRRLDPSRTACEKPNRRRSRFMRAEDLAGGAPSSRPPGHLFFFVPAPSAGLVTESVTTEMSRYRSSTSLALGRVHSLPSRRRLSSPSQPPSQRLNKYLTSSPPIVDFDLSVRRRGTRARPEPTWSQTGSSTSSRVAKRRRCRLCRRHHEERF